MIPKVIHYCWFGGIPKPDTFKQCLESWKLYCPDFKIIEWNEESCKPFRNKFYKDTLRKKKYAFTSDFVRMKVLYEYGGVYLDTDMLLLKPLDCLLEHIFFTGEEVEGRVAFGLFGGSKFHRFFKQALNYYESNEFNEFSLPIITQIFDTVINKTNLLRNEIIYESNYFYSLTYENRCEKYDKFIDEDSYAVHLWNHSWKEEKKIGFLFYILGIKRVIIDYVFYGYSKPYFIRYLIGFSRQIYYLLKDKL
jgi:mannosyltransferase OCH1-like enzyme